MLFVSSFSGRVEEWRGSRLEDFLRPWPTFLHAASDLPSAALVLAHRQHQLQHQRHRQHHIQALTKSRYPDPSRPENWKWPGTRKIVFQFKSNRTQHRMRNVANKMTLPTHPNTENHYLVIYLDTRTFLQVPNPSRPGVKNQYPPGSDHIIINIIADRSLKQTSFLTKRFCHQMASVMSPTLNSHGWAHAVQQNFEVSLLEYTTPYS